MMGGCKARRMRIGRCRLIIGSSSGAFNCVLLRGKNHGSNARSRNRVYHGHGCWVLPLLVQACSVGLETPSQRYKVVKAVQRVASVVPDHSFKKVYPWASDRLGETGGERPHKRLSKFDSLRTSRAAGSGNPEMVQFCAFPEWDFPF
jgi:hypothetical protein